MQRLVGGGGGGEGVCAHLRPDIRQPCWFSVVIRVSWISQLTFAERWLAETLPQISLHPSSEQPPPVLHPFSPAPPILKTVAVAAAE